MHEKLTVAVVYGSTRKGRFCDTVVRWVEQRLAGRVEFRIDVIDPSQSDGGEAPALRRQAEAADAFVIVTPEYNHSFPGPLKTFIDSMTTEWRIKPVAFVSYGGVSGGLRAVEHLRGVFAELRAVAIRDCLSFQNARDRFDGAGRLTAPAGPERAMDTMLDNLGWWAATLRAVRPAAKRTEVTA